MRLSKIKLAGFKSFVDPTTIPFPSNRVGVVGPNGCGKSNTIDAVRWVMGESSAKYLRGDSMEDVIFNGSSSRKPVGQASIELVFDNSDGGLGGQYAQYNEIAIKRRVSRDGQSQYFLNGTRCRRRDITDIFLGTGLGPRSYAIIEQGMISRLIEAKPEELRVYLEEAAGISKYKERRRETENRIRHTRENLERLQDVRDEVEKHLKHLQRQAETAEKYKSLRDEERRVKAELLALRLRDLDQEAQRREQTLRTQETRLEEVVASQRQQETALERDRQALHEANETLNQVQGRYYRLGADISGTEQSIRHHKEMQERQSRELQQAEQAQAETTGHIQADEERLVDVLAALEDLEPEHEVGNEALEEVNERLSEAEQAMNDWQGRWEDFNRRAAEPSQVAQVERARLEQLENQIGQLDARHGRLDDELKGLSTEGLQAEIDTVAEEVEQAREQERALQGTLRETADCIQENRDESRTQAAELEEWRRRLQAHGGRLASLEALQQAALGKETRTLVDWLEGQGLDGAPRLGEALDVEPGWEKAAETVLGPFLEAVCVEDLEAVARVTGSLEQGQLVLFEEAGKPPAETGKGDLLAHRVTTRLPLDTLLRGIHTAPDLDAALALRPRLEPHESVITPEGLWLGPRWLRIARDHDEHAGLLARDKEIRSLKEEIETLREAVDTRQTLIEDQRETRRELEAERDRLQQEVNGAHRTVSDLQAQLSNRQTRLEQMETRIQRVSDEMADIRQTRERDAQALQQATRKRNEAVSQMEVLAREREGLDAERDTLRQSLEAVRSEARTRRDAVHQVALQVQSLTASRDATQQSLTRMRSQASQLELRLETLRESLDASGEPILELETTLETLVGERVALEDELARARAQVQSLEARMRETDQARVTQEREAESLRQGLDELRMAWQEIKVRRQTSLEQLQESGFEADTLLAQLDAEAGVEAWQSRADELAQRIQRLGAINLAAIDEYREQSERKQYLDNQYADLVEALETLENAIQRIDRETRSRFRETFERVNLRLKEMFPRLFGGGQAHLEMTGDDLLTTGVAVLARPPGKRLSTIHLMSGGEKALTAVALVFAIFELNPAPFCMLDEVDAPLDEANVGRFCDLVREMSERVQFIFITHNKATMEMADQLIGVTMREPGVSRLVTVDVEEAAQMAIG
ncbi:chromosome segregation protein SMC [Ectothiorhodospira haloalkaliphila]|uniref:Chromosome partition protein Smc n=1 Tax=Ectothiorhodospira haloalkaliphila TaxID=421628 RepID=W8L6T8_9GAMM|nr:chromosome segregation protein SMC [Ectothiorhodospira haloalkaliphila]AHK79575.1 chromosome segregation protein SMC [Ectothiorhodospira haloalkaliphila]